MNVCAILERFKITISCKTRSVILFVSRTNFPKTFALLDVRNMPPNAGLRKDLQRMTRNCIKVVHYNENFFFIFKVFEPKFSDVLALDTLSTNT